jgi:hypothetical protein
MTRSCNLDMLHAPRGCAMVVLDVFAYVCPLTSSLLADSLS